MQKVKLSIEQQINLLIDRGLIIDQNDSDDFADFLLNTNYYRLSGYFHQFQDRETNAQKNHSFLQGTNFRSIKNVYDLDQELRSLLLMGLFTFEVALKSRFAYFFSHLVDPYSYAVSKTYQVHKVNGIKPETIVDRVQKAITESKEQFVTHHLVNGTKVPIWVAVECISISSLSIMYSNLKDLDVQWTIAKSFGLKNPKLAGSTIRSLATLRNLCAHNSRLWKRSPDYPPPVLNSLKIEEDKSIYESTPWAWIVTLCYLVDGINRSSNYSELLNQFLSENPEFTNGLKFPRIPN